MSSNPWEITLLNKLHDRKSFDCLEPALNNYLHNYASQDIRKNLNRMFVATAKKYSNKILGFYTLCTGNITFENLPTTINKKLPRYPIPIVRLGRLAVDKYSQKQGLGEHLLMDALHRSTTHAEEIGIFGVVVDAKHESAKSFYQRYGFSELTEKPLTLILPIQSSLKSNRI